MDSPKTNSFVNKCDNQVTFSSSHTQVHHPFSNRSSVGFRDQILQLDNEGSKLLNATAYLGESLGALCSNPVSTNIQSSCNNTNLYSVIHSPLHSSIAELTDISKEQNTISELEAHLDVTSLATGRLRNELLANSCSSSTSIFQSQSITRNINSFNSQLAVEDCKISSPQKFTDVPQNQSSSKSCNFSLEDYKHEVITLRSRLSDALDITQKQKEEYLSIIEKLREELLSLSIQKEKFVSERYQSANQLESNLNQTQIALEEMTKDYHQNKQTLEGFKKQLENSEHELSATKLSFEQLGHILSRHKDQYNRVSSVKLKSFLEMSLNEMILFLEQYLSDQVAWDNQLELKYNQINQEISAIKAENRIKLQQTSQEYSDKLSALKSQHKATLSQNIEETTKKNTEFLNEKITKMQFTHSKTIEMKNKEITELELMVNKIRKELSECTLELCEQKKRMKLTLEQSEKDLIVVKKERDEVIHNNSTIELKSKEIQDHLTKLQTELELKKNDFITEQQKCEEAVQIHQSLLITLSERDEEVSKLRKLLASVKQDCNSQLQSMIDKNEKESAEKNDCRLKTLTENLNDVTIKYQKTCLELDFTKKELQNLKEQYNSIKTSSNETAARLAVSSESFERLTSSLEKRTAQLCDITAAKQRSDELTETARREVERLTAEATSNSAALSERSAELAATLTRASAAEQALTAARADATAAATERDRSVALLSATQSDADRNARRVVELETRLGYTSDAREHAETKLKQVSDDCYIQRVNATALRDECDRLSEHVTRLQLQQTRDNEANELLRVSASHREDALKHEKDITLSKLHALEHELKLSKQALKVHKRVDNKAIKMAGKMQHEVTEKRGLVDKLQSHICLLEENLKNALKDKMILEKDHSKLLITCKELPAKSPDKIDQNIPTFKKYKETIIKLENALKKAAIKYSNSQAQVEKYEQDITMLKLQHQLDIKEFEKHVNKKVSTVSVAICTNEALEKHAQKVSKNMEEIKKNTENQLVGLHEKDFCCTNVEDAQILNRKSDSKSLKMVNSMKTLLQTIKTVDFTDKDILLKSKLEKKIDMLTEMGAHLKIENKQIAAMINFEHDTKIQEK